MAKTFLRCDRKTKHLNFWSWNCVECELKSNFFISALFSYILILKKMVPKVRPKQQKFDFLPGNNGNVGSLLHSVTLI